MGAELNRPPEGSTNTVPARDGDVLHGPYQGSAETGAHHGARTMQALVQHRYGSPDMLSVAEVPRPVPAAGEVLVRVQAASVNARDWHIMRGEPWLARLDRTTFGRLGPKVKVRGTDFAGIVESTGASVTRWRRGDTVFGESSAAIAEYVTTSADLLAAIPPSTTFEQAAALPLAANTALTLLRAGDPGAGRSVLINGASGGVGTFAVQLAKHMGLHVTAVCSERNADLVRSLGADVVIDYRQDDFCDLERVYDLVVDLVGNRSLSDMRRILNPSGSLVLSGGGVSGEGRFLGPLAMLVRAKLVAGISGLRVLTPVAKPSGELLYEIAELVKSGAITPVVDRTFAFEDADEAIRYLEREHARAKVIIRMRRPG